MESPREKFRLALSGRYTRHEADSLWRAFVSAVCRVPENQAYFREDSDFTEAQRARLEAIGAELAAGVPYQHLLGYQELGGLRFKVSANTLIPRPETAELAEWIQSDLARRPPAAILDLGTGCGYLAIVLALAFPDAEVTAVDLSAKALEVACENARLHRVSVHFAEADMLQPLPLGDTRFDLIVSNPPYITPSEKAAMSDTVWAHEPAMALFAPEGRPLLFYESIARTASDRLTPGGSLYLEINQRFGAGTLRLLEKEGFSAALRQDSFGHDRMIRASRRL